MRKDAAYFRISHPSSQQSLNLRFCSEMATHLPDRSASAAHVRRFITDVLVSDYDAEPDFASETARTWRIGRGAELHDAKERYFVDIFGVETGVCLYRSVLNAREKQWQNSRTGILFKCRLPL